MAIWDQRTVGARDRHFVEVHFRQRRVAALWGAESDFRHLSAQMDTSSWRRRAISTALPIAGTVRSLVHRVYRRDLPPSREIQQLTGPLLDVAGDHNLDIRSLAVFWPTGVQAHRRYVIGLDAEHQPLLFVKVSTRPEVDRDLLRRECGLLLHLAKEPLEFWQTPRSYGLVSTPGQVALITQAMSANRRNLSWKQVARSVPLLSSTSPGPHTAIAGDLDWFPPNLGALDCSVSIGRTLHALRTKPVRVGLAHSDIRPSNAFRAAGQRWLIDWEGGCTMAPIAADVVGSILNHLTVPRRGRRLEVVQAALLQRCRERGLNTADVVLSLLFLASVRSVWAAALLSTSWSLDADLKQVDCEA